MAKDGDMDEDMEENKDEDKEQSKDKDKDSIDNNDGDEAVDENGLPGPPWALRTRCSLLFPVNKYFLDALAYLDLKLSLSFYTSMQLQCIFILVHLSPQI